MGCQSVSLCLLGGESLNVAPAPSFPDRRGLSYLASGCDLDALGMLGSVLFHHLLVLRLVNLLGALVVCLRHLLTHDLSEGIIGALRVEPLLLGLLLLFSSFLLASLSLYSLDVRLGEDTLGARLPVSFVKFRLFEAVRALKFPRGIVDTDLVINLDSLMEDCREDMLSIWGPGNADCAIGLSLPDLFVAIEGPEVDFSRKVSEATNKYGLGKWANSNCVPIAFPILEKWLTMLVIEGGYCGLHARDDNESLSVWDPNNIMNHVVEDWDKRPCLSPLQLNILACMLTIVAFAGRVNEVL